MNNIFKSKKTKTMEILLSQLTLKQTEIEKLQAQNRYLEVDRVLECYYCVIPPQRSSSLPVQQERTQRDRSLTPSQLEGWTKIVQSEFPLEHQLLKKCVKWSDE